MHWGKAILLVVGLLCVAALMALAVQFSRCPIGTRIKSVDPSLMVDSSWILTIALVTAEDETVLIDSPSLRFEAKAGKGWLAITNLWPGASWVTPHGESRFLALVPQGIQACRFRLNYSTQTSKERLVTFLRNHLPKVFVNHPALSNWLWPPRAPGWVPPPRHWTEAEFEVSVPQVR
jgi:hypothetical protein